jgi:hypothetical protein
MKHVARMEDMRCIYFCYQTHEHSIAGRSILPCVQMTVGTCKQINIPTLYQVSSRFVTIYICTLFYDIFVLGI